ncbi:MAG: PepSY domain-containing protein [Acidimicrobiales bacterium]|nr:PepSY domain-containing protein [Hyphomonadaceae bacterium]RZV42671.1 MAG: PepSY domain-containing protein [Acidimicrobiales bacterium]
MSPKTSRTLFRWHRRIGITSALFVLILSITGLLLMFSTSLDLDQKTWGGGLVKSVYNLEPESAPVGLPIVDAQGKQQWVVFVDDLIYIGEADPIPLEQPLLSAGWRGEFIFITNGEEDILTLEDGTLVERSQTSATFEAMQTRPVPENIEEKVLDRFAGRGMPASRILLDIHTGRFFGKIGTWLMGLASILLILLSVTGIYMWTTTDVRRARREKMKKELAKLKGGE